eukprot:5059829-Alexandrium_andersonii.AAC.1
MSLPFERLAPMVVSAASPLSTCLVVPRPLICVTFTGCRAGGVHGWSLAISTWTSARRATSAR